MKEKKQKKWVACSTEASYFGDDRKIARSDRKRASKTDRSQFKKSDQDQLKKHEKVSTEFNHLPLGRVLSITAQGVNVEYEDTLFSCTLRGSLKKEMLQIKNLITVGDFVRFENLGNKTGVINQIHPRKSVLSRADNLHRRREQLIAANIDQVLITASVVHPAFKPFLIDRYIIAAHKGNMQPIVVINKIDLLQDDPKEAELLKEFIDSWKEAHIPIFCVSTTTGEGLDTLKKKMRDKTSVFSGQSGVGKSSLINAVTGHNLVVGSVVMKTKKGSHTTTSATLLPLEEGGFVIDTPGIKSFGVWDLNRSEVESYFSDISRFGESCKFQDCSHRMETHCAVKEAVEQGLISPLRYSSYLYLVESLEEKHLKR